MVLHTSLYISIYNNGNVNDAMYVFIYNLLLKLKLKKPKEKSEEYE